MPKRIFLVSFLILLAPITTQNLVFAGTTPPITDHVMTPSSPDGNNDWYVSPVQFDLTATDLESGVKDINYRIDGGTWSTVSFSDTLNLALNPSFETAGATTSGADKWEATLLDADTIYSQDPVIFAPGFANSSAKVVTATANPSLWHGVNNKDNFAVAFAYENMTASAWLKTSGAVGNAYFKVYSIGDDGFGGELITLLGSSAAITGTTDWTFVSLNFAALPASVTGIYLEIGLEGAGTMWADAVTINSSVQTTKTTVIVGSDSATHTMEYRAVDQVGNSETSSCVAPLVNCVEFKVDMTPPGNWQNSGAFRSVGGGPSAEHELWVHTDVNDATSGLSTAQSEYQYDVDAEPDFGHYDVLLGCNTTWNLGNWVPVEQGVLVNGDPTAYLQTQKTDFCNSNWKICKSVRFEAEDMAGNYTTKDFCINGPWIRLRGEAVARSNQNIDMLSEPEGDNTDSLIEVGGNSIDFFTSSKNWDITSSPTPKNYTYTDFWNLTSSQSEITNNRLIDTDGVYYVTGNFTIANSNTPPGYDSGSFDQVVFINGDLTISSDVRTAATTAALFIVSGDVNIEKSVNEIQIAILADGDFYTASNIAEGQSSSTLVLNGMYSADTFVFQRTLQGTNNDENPSEDFIFEPKYLVNLKDFFGNYTVSWRSAE